MWRNGSIGTDKQRTLLYSILTALRMDDRHCVAYHTHEIPLAALSGILNMTIVVYQRLRRDSTATARQVPKNAPSQAAPGSPAHLVTAGVGDLDSELLWSRTFRVRPIFHHGLREGEVPARIRAGMQRTKCSLHEIRDDMEVDGGPVSEGLWHKIPARCTVCRPEILD